MMRLEKSNVGIPPAALLYISAIRPIFTSGAEFWNG